MYSSFSRLNLATFLKGVINRKWQSVVRDQKKKRGLHVGERSKNEEPDGRQEIQKKVNEQYFHQEVRRKRRDSGRGGKREGDREGESEVERAR